MTPFGPDYRDEFCGGKRDKSVDLKRLHEVLLQSSRGMKQGRKTIKFYNNPQAYLEIFL